MREAALISVSIILGAGLIAYHPHHPFGWGKASAAPACQTAANEYTWNALPGVPFCKP